MVGETVNDPGDRGSVLNAVAVASLNADGVVVGWSRGASVLLGLSAGEVCGRPITGLVAGEIEPPPEGWKRCAAAGGRARLRHGLGGTVEVAFQLLPFEDGDGGDFLVAAVPLGVATAWEEGASLVRAFLAQERVGMAIHDVDLNVVRSNVTADTFGGARVPRGGRLGAVARAEDAAAVETVLRRVLETGVPVIDWEQRMRFLRVPGREWLLLLSAFRLEDEEGEPTGVAVSFYDITEQQRVRHHLDLLHGSVSRIGSSLDVIGTSQELADVLAPDFGDLATVDISESVLSGDEPSTYSGGRTHFFRAAVGTGSSTWPPGLLAAGSAYPDRIADSPELRRLQEGGVVTLTRAGVTAAMGDQAGLFVPADAHALMVAPLLARGLALGVISVWRTQPGKPFEEHEKVLLAEIAATGALALDNARRFTREHRAAVALQERLLPNAATDTPGTETAGIYRPSGGRAGISGDWFDVIPLPSLRVALVIGDVTGHGLAATAMMGRLRTAIQSFADLELDPAEVLAHVEGLVQRLAAETPSGQRDMVGATCLFAVYDPITRRCVLASAGQPPPLLIRPSGQAQFVDVSPGPPLGVGGVPFESTTIDLEPGSVLALYTDGLLGIEDLGVEAGMRRLREGLSTLCRPECVLGQAGEAVVAELGNRPVRDDMALLLARTRALAPDNTVSWNFPAVPTSVAEARRLTSRQLSSWGLEDLAFTTELVLSELVTNAIRYAGGPVGVRLIREDELICEVTDPSNTQPRLLRAGVTDEGGRGLFIVAQCSSRWGSRYGQSGKTIWAEQPLNGRGPQLAPQ